MPWNALWWIAKRDLEYVCICSLTMFDQHCSLGSCFFYWWPCPLTYLVPWLTDYLLQFVPSCFMLLSSDSLSRTRSSHSKFHVQPVSSGEDPADFMPDNILDQGIVFTGWVNTSRHAERDGESRESRAESCLVWKQSCVFVLSCSTLMKCG